MAFTFSEELKDEVRERTDIVQIIGESVRLKRSGSNFVGLCPFHKEKSPSFSVNPAKRIFYCFGCHEGGDVFRFLMKKENLSFPVVVEKLAVAAGIDLSRYQKSDPNGGSLSRLVDAHAVAHEFYVKALAGSAQARDYLAGRGLTSETISTFGLGYAPDDWTRLCDHLTSQGFTERELLAAGLVRQREKRDGSYDYFRNRVVFPIRDERGRVVGFGGRVLGDEKPKYLNSPETPLYSKGRLLYNLDRVAKAGPGETLVLVEGYMDVVGLAQGGVTNVVATLGTALTEPQIRKIARLTKLLYLAYDPDEAGIRATLRSLELLESSGLTLKVLRLPEGVDPDELVIQEGRAAWDRVLSEAVEVEDFLFDHVVAPFNLESVTERREAFRELKRSFAVLPTPEGRERFLRRVSDKLGLGDDVVRSSFTTNKEKRLSDEILTPAKPEEQLSPIALKERFLLACFLSDPELLRHHADLSYDSLEDPLVRRAFELWAALGTKPARKGDDAATGPTLHEVLADRDGSDEFRAFLASLTVSFVLPAGGTETAVSECLALLKRHRLERRRKELFEQLRKCSDPGGREELNRELSRVLREVARP